MIFKDLGKPHVWNITILSCAAYFGTFKDVKQISRGTFSFIHSLSELLYSKSIYQRRRKLSEPEP